MSVTELKDELKVVSEIAGKIKGVHAKVSSKCGISTDYCVKIRNANGAKEDTKENRKLITKLIKHYRKELNDYAKEIEVVI